MRQRVRPLRKPDHANRSSVGSIGLHIGWGKDKVTLSSSRPIWQAQNSLLTRVVSSLRWDKFLKFKLVIEFARSKLTGHEPSTATLSFAADFTPLLLFGDIDSAMMIVPNKEAEFKGVYLAHCLDERIQVDADTRLGIVIRHESWKPTFPPKFVAPGGEQFPQLLPSNANCLPFYIRFVGTPGDAEICGHMGCCQRRVTVREILELKEVESGIG